MTGRVMKITAPDDAGELLFSNMHVREELGRPFEYQIEVLSLSSAVDPTKLLGQRITVHLELPTGTYRHFNAYVTEFTFHGISGRYYRYQLVAKPWLWMLSKSSDCRIFQHQTTPEIIDTIFKKYGISKVESRLTCTYRAWEYCVQYRETDLNFVSRLMEYEGIYYFFIHELNDKNVVEHKLVLCDGPNAHKEYPGFEEIPFGVNASSSRQNTERITDWRFSCRVQTGTFVLEDYDFKKPSANLITRASQPNKHQEAAHEFYDYPGEYTVTGDGDNYSRTRLEEVNARYDVASGSGNPRGLTIGHLFTLSGMPRDDQNQKYLVTSATHFMSYNGYESDGAEGGADYQCTFTVIPAESQYRSARITPRTFVQGPQTAIVVGPAGDEVYVDNFGRVKVQFHWDRLGQKNENSSCWIRVASPWAGKNYGMIAIPRIGQEVIVDFEEGNPDRPIITGRVYNAEQMPPYTLPDNKTQTGILTRSSKGGIASNANELRFEDKKGEEHLLIHAEKDQMIEVENDETHWVGRDRTKTIDRDETNHIKRHRTEIVDGNETINVHQNRTETVDKDETITIHQNRKERVDMNESISVGGNRNRDVTGNEAVTVSKNRDKAVTINETDTIGKSWSIHVGQTKAENIGMICQQNVKLLKMTNVLGIRNENITASASIVGPLRYEFTGMNKIETVGGERTTSIAKDDTLTVGETLKISAKTIELTAAAEIKLTCGSTSITFTPANLIELSTKTNINCK